MRKNHSFGHYLTPVLSALLLAAPFLFGLMPPLQQAAASSSEILTKHKLISDYDFPGLKIKTSLDIRGMDVVQFLKFMATEGDLNIVASKNVSGPVNLLISDVTIGDALEIVLSMNNLAYEVKGNIISVMTNAEYKTMFGVDFYDQRKTVIYELKYASVKNVATMLGNVKSEIGKIIYDEGTGIIVIIDTPAKIAEMTKVIEKQELPTIVRIYPTETRVFELKFAKIDMVKDEISKFLTPDIGSIRSDIRTNTFIVTDLPSQFEKIEVAIKTFDRRVRQVFIEAKIVEVTLGDKFEWGVDWNLVIKLLGSATGYKIVPDMAFPLSATTAGKITVGHVTGTGNFDAVLQILNTITETRILSNPHLTVEEGKEAKIEVIEKQPYEEDTTTTASGGTSTTSKTYQWVDVGVTMNVTCRINDEGDINMLIKPQISSISTWYGGEAQAAGTVPVVKSANAQTTVTVKDGTTIIIAGLVKDNKTQTMLKIPLLGDLPFLGNAFKKISNEVTRTETIIFITPRIVEGDKFFILEKDMIKPIKGLRE